MSLVQSARIAIGILGLLGLTSTALATGPETCPGLVAAREHLVTPAVIGRDEVGLTFVGHATFLIETPQGVRIASDYNDGVRLRVTPDVATMN